TWRRRRTPWRRSRTGTATRPDLPGCRWRPDGLERAGSRRVAHDRAAHAARPAAAATELPAGDVEDLDAVAAQVPVGRDGALVGHDHPRGHGEGVAPVVPLL